MRRELLVLRRVHAVREAEGARAARERSGDARVLVDVSLYLATVVMFLALGPWRSRWVTERLPATETAGPARRSLLTAHAF